MNPDRDSDPTLTEIGFKQAAALGKYASEAFGEVAVREGRLKAKHAIRRLYVSPMRRCMLTATPMSEALGVQIRVKGDIHEHGGCFDGAAGEPGGVVGLPGMTKAQLEKEFPGCKVPIELAGGWWEEKKGCETVPQAQERVAGVVEWLWEKAEKWKESQGAMCIVVHGMFIDILTKALCGCEMTTGKQNMVFCSQNAGVHVFELKPGVEGNPGRIAGLQRFNVLDHLPPEIRTGGSVEGLDDCYMNEAARDETVSDGDVSVHGNIRLAKKNPLFFVTRHRAPDSLHSSHARTHRGLPSQPSLLSAPHERPEAPLHVRVVRVDGAEFDLIQPHLGTSAPPR